MPTPTRPRKPPVAVSGLVALVVAVAVLASAQPSAQARVPEGLGTRKQLRFDGKVSVMGSLVVDDVADGREDCHWGPIVTRRMTSRFQMSDVRLRRVWTGQNRMAGSTHAPADGYVHTPEILNVEYPPPTPCGSAPIFPDAPPACTPAVLQLVPVLMSNTLRMGKGISYDDPVFLRLQMGYVPSEVNQAVESCEFFGAPIFSPRFVSWDWLEDQSPTALVTPGDNSELTIPLGITRRQLLKLVVGRRQSFTSTISGACDAIVISGWPSPPKAPDDPVNPGAPGPATRCSVSGSVTASFTRTTKGRIVQPNGFAG